MMLLVGLFIGILKNFVCWGAILFVVFHFGFQIPVNTFWVMINDGSMYIALRIIAGILLLSIVLLPVYVLKSVIGKTKTKLQAMKAGYPYSIFVNFIVFSYPDLWSPYKGFFIGDLFKEIKKGYSKDILLFDARVYILRLLDTLIWWAFAIQGTLCVLRYTPNCFVDAVMSASIERKIIVVGAVIAFFVFRWLLYKLCYEKGKRDNRSGPIRKRRRKRKKEFNGYVPSGCSACGGPYPSCVESCPVFDGKN